MDRCEPPVFSRSPRIFPELPGGEVEIPAPPPAPSEPHASVVSILISLLPGLAGPLLMFLLARPSGAKPGSYVFYSLPMMAIGALLQLGNLAWQRQKYHQGMAVREQRYQDLLARHTRELERARAQQHAALLETDPEPAECLERVERRNANLWERSPQDPDFLALRLGVGALPCAVTVKVPRQERAAEPDPLEQQARSLADQFVRVDGVPIRLALPDVGVAGLSGPRARVLASARSLVMQLATHHSPDEVKLAALFPEDEGDDWAWLRWLPHTRAEESGSRQIAADRTDAHRLLKDLYELLKRRQLRAEGSQEGPATVIFVGAMSLIENEPILPLLLREGPALGAYPVFLSERKEQLPKECRGIVELTAGGGQLIQTAPTRLQISFSPDEATVEPAERLARAMAPVRLQRTATAAEIPAAVSLVNLLGGRRLSELGLPGRWQSSEPYRSLAVPIGLRAGGEQVVLDIHERGHGPHGLVAGATGSGKSELLQTIITSLAVSYHPHDLMFVVVDYKGGGMVGGFAGLPHLAGTITNLEGNLAKRALAALKAELKRRQRLLAEAEVNHIDEYIRLRRQGRSLAPLPHLVVIVDEFAELKADQPEFMRDLVSAVRVGRSLGVHLILATQKPAGVVDEQIWSNTGFRLCLRVARPQDSQEVLKCPDAAFITGAGRGYFQVGNNERFELFQAGWGGAPYEPDAAVADDSVRLFEVALDGSRFPLGPSPQRTAAPAARTQLQALVEALHDAAEQAGIKPLTGPWLPPLPQQVVLSDLRAEASGWLEPVVGLVDDPEHQVQEPLRVNLGREGHLAVYGAPGTGKTTLVQSLIISLAGTYTPEEVHLYLVDCSGRTQSLFAPLPHVGGVILGDESERISRLLRLLLKELESRKERFARSGVTTLGAYRQLGGDRLPAIVLVMDNYPAFAAAYPDGEEQVAQIAREGGGLGIHLVLTAASPGAIRAKVAGSITMAVALQMADRSDYGAVVGRTGGLEPMAVPGRGLVKANPPLEFQTALPVAGETEWERTGALREWVSRLAAAWSGPRPVPVRVLPECVQLGELGAPEDPGAGSPAVPVGLEAESLDVFRADLRDGPHFVIAGPAESGKTTLLRTWLVSLAERNPPERLELWLVDMGMGGLRPLKGLPHVRAYVTDGAGLAEIVDRIAADLPERRRQVSEGGQPPEMVVAIDDFEWFRDGAPPGVKEKLEQMIRRERGLGFHLLAAGQTLAFSQGYDGLTKALKELQTGFLLGSSDAGDLSLFNLRLPMGETGRLLPPGLGFYARRGRYRKIKAAVASGAAALLSTRGESTA